MNTYFDYQKPEIKEHWISKEVEAQSEIVMTPARINGQGLNANVFDECVAYVYREN